MVITKSSTVIITNSTMNDRIGRNYVESFNFEFLDQLHQ